MTAPTLLRKPFSTPLPMNWRAGIHRVEEDTQGTPELRSDFVRNALALFQPLSVLELSGDAPLRSRLVREGHAVYAGTIGHTSSASYPPLVQRIIGVTQYFGYGAGTAATDALPFLAGRLANWGWLGLKILDRDQLPYWLPDEEVVRRAETWYRLSFRFDRRSGVLDISSRPLNKQAKTEEDGSFQTSRLKLRTFTLTEIEHLLARSGLQLEGAFGGWRGEASEKSSKALWLVARKKPGKPASLI